MAVLRPKSRLAVLIPFQDIIQHAPQYRQTLLQRLKIVRVIVRTRRIPQEHSDIQWPLYLILSVVKEVAVGKNVFLQVVLKVPVRAVCAIPELMGPNEFVEGNRKQRMT